MRIVCACQYREQTPSQLAARTGVAIDTVRRHFSALEEAGFLEVIREEQARGFVRKHYRSTRTALITDAEYARLGAKERRNWTAAALEDYAECCKESLAEKTIDRRDNSHFAWGVLHLDQDGFDALSRLEARLFDELQEIQAESSVRLRHSGAAAIPTVYGLAAFEGPADLNASRCD